MTSRRQVLEAERERLLAEQADLLRHLPAMEPAMAARAATVLADKLAELASQYETRLEQGTSQYVPPWLPCLPWRVSVPLGTPFPRENESLLEDDHGDHK